MRRWRRCFRGAGIETTVDGATVGEANGWSLNPAEGLPLIGDLNSSCTNRPFHRPRNMHIVGSDPAFHVSGCSDVNNLTDQLTLNSARHLKVVSLQGTLNGRLSIDIGTIQVK
jgi:hypothetical protein